MPIAETIRAASIAGELLAEFECQAAVTRRFLERLPEDKLTWKPHERSMTAGQLAFHLASVPAGVVLLVATNPAQVRAGFVFPQPSSCREVLEKLDESLPLVREALLQFDDEAMRQTWRLMGDGRELVAQPRMQVLRDLMFSHWYQHRGQFSVYLRLLDIPVPASWGPSADESPV